MVGFLQCAGGDDGKTFDCVVSTEYIKAYVGPILGCRCAWTDEAWCRLRTGSAGPGPGWTPLREMTSLNGLGLHDEQQTTENGTVRNTDRCDVELCPTSVGQFAQCDDGHPRHDLSHSAPCR